MMYYILMIISSSARQHQGSTPSAMNISVATLIVLTCLRLEEYMSSLMTKNYDDLSLNCLTTSRFDVKCKVIIIGVASLNALVVLIC